jgi:hypothetical protein
MGELTNIWLTVNYLNMYIFKVQNSIIVANDLIGLFWPIKICHANLMTFCLAFKQIYQMITFDEIDNDFANKYFDIQAKKF